MVEQRLESLRYEKIRRNSWIRKEQVVRIVRFSEFGKGYIRTKWKEDWKNDYAVIYDYTGRGGPVCIVPMSTLFESEFVKEKTIH